MLFNTLASSCTKINRLLLFFLPTKMEVCGMTCDGRGIYAVRLTKKKKELRNSIKIVNHGVAFSLLV
jgi:hypothetical protein